MIEVSYLIKNPFVALKVVPGDYFVPQTAIVNVLLPAILSRREERLRKKNHPLNK